MKVLNPELLRRFLDLASQQLKGEWLLIGGTLLPAVGLHVRSTMDIDLVGLHEKEMAQTLKLMEISENLGLSIESINQAAAFFVKKVGYTKEDLIPLKEGKEATIYRPSFELYLKLKTTRLTETDLIDCLHYFNYCQSQRDKISQPQLQRVIKKALKLPNLAPEKAYRLQELAKVFGS